MVKFAFCTEILKFLMLISASILWLGTSMSLPDSSTMGKIGEVALGGVSVSLVFLFCCSLTVLRYYQNVEVLDNAREKLLFGAVFFTVGFVMERLILFTDGFELNSLFSMADDISWGERLFSVAVAFLPPFVMDKFVKKS